jgi:hypothetical protein
MPDPNLPGGLLTQYLLSDRLSTRLVLDASGNALGRQGHLAFGEDFGERFPRIENNR